MHNEIRFTGVLRKHVKVYVVTGIDLESTEEGLCDFLKDLNVQFKSAKFKYTRTDCRVARVVEDANDSSIVEDENNWPERIHCRSWLKVEDVVETSLPIKVLSSSLMSKLNIMSKNAK